MADRPLAIDIAQPLLCKGNELFLLTERGGGIPGDRPGMGLFYRDCRYLSRFELRLHGIQPLRLMSSGELGFSAVIELTNDNLKTSNGRPIPAHALGIRRRRLLADDEPLWIEWLRLRNFHVEAIEVPLSLSFAAEFEDMFTLRGSSIGIRGDMRRPEIGPDSLRFAYLGADGILRQLDVHFSDKTVVEPRTSEETTAHFDVELAPQQSYDLVIFFHVQESLGDAEPPPWRPPSLAPDELLRRVEHRAQTRLDGFATIESDFPPLDAVVTRSLSDIRLLQTERDEGRFIAAGVPWYVAVFGRDSLIPSIQCLAFDPDLAARTVRLLAHWQGVGLDPRRHEEPGKILHELRVGEFANLGKVPQTPAYNTVDATILFLIALGQHARWAGTLTLFEELRENVERALGWMAQYGDANHDGYIEYDGMSDGHPVNQGWKDSADGIVRTDGSFPEAPISLAEVQGYAYLAKTSIAALYARAGEQKTADRLVEEAEALRQRFNRDYWMEDEGCFCLALEKGGRPVRSVASNAGQALWTGIAEDDKGRRTVERLMRDDMFGGWGVRTLTALTARFNPFAYQLGSIWPFDNSLVLAGFRRYGGDDAALSVFSALLDAAQHYPYDRLPEFFSGLAREPGAAPVHCPRADPLQAWTAGAFPYMLTALLGLEPDGFAGRLRVVRPILPPAVGRLELRGLRVGKGVADLRFERDSDGRLRGSASTTGPLDVEFV